MSKIKDVKARWILDSRGNPTVETDVKTENGFGRAAVPSGASTGEHEALELRDEDDRFHGKGVRKAVENVNNIISESIIGMECHNLKEIDRKMVELDGTPDKSALGANAILSVSMAAARAAADEDNKPLYGLLHERFSSHCETGIPRLFSNILNGGEHAGNDLAVQEFMIVPFADSAEESVRMISEIYHSLKNILKEKYGPSATNVGDEGGFAPPISDTHKALDLVVEAIGKAGYTPDEDAKIVMDAAASEFFRGGKYHIDGDEKTSDELLDFWIELTEKYPIYSLEDPFGQEDFEAFARLTEETDELVVGDDLLVTNTERIQEALDVGACNTLLLKVNQIGTLSEAVSAAKLAQKNGWKVVVSHRSGETCDNFISDLSVALNAYGIKTGAPARGERTAKYNRLIRIEEKL